MDQMIGWHPAGCVDAIFADPPYFLSNGGSGCRGGRRVNVNKGAWDKSLGVTANHQFNLQWLSRCQRLLRPDGTIWVSGTHHVIFSIGHAMQELGFRILNDIAWEKPNPPPNLGCRCFTHSTETILWAARSVKSRHRFNYPLMRQLAGGRQMKTVWRFPAPGRAEKTAGRHPTQKPLALIERCLLASTDEGASVLDPFLGSGTTAVACARLGRNCVGIEQDAAYCQLAIDRVKAV
jgi:site-specific DNA-methyltransferase (adenine-specific)